MKIIFFGTPEFVIPVLKALAEHFDIAAVVTAPDHILRKKHLAVSSPVKSFYQHYYETHPDLNERHPLQIVTPEYLDERFTKQLSSLKPELFVVAAYGKIIPKELLTIPVFGCLNVHPSLLPKYRGTSPIQAAILNGDTVTGVTIIKLDEQMDHGPILASEPESVLETDTFETLIKRLFNKSAEMLPRVIKEYTAGNIQPLTQDDTQATYTKRITKQDGYIDLSAMENGKWKISSGAESGFAREIQRKIRAYYPWPGVWTKVRIKNQEIRIKFLPREKMQVEGGKPMNIKDFLNGYPELKTILQKIY